MLQTSKAPALNRVSSRFLKKLSAILFLLLGIGLQARATSSQPPLKFYDGRSFLSVSAEEVYAKLVPGTVLFLGEYHDSATHHRQQVSFLQEAGQRAQRASASFALGMEFIAYTQQTLVDAHLQGSLNEAEFLEKLAWSGIPFSEYRDQLHAPRAAGGWTYGINLPREVSKRIAAVGLENLSDAERALLPPSPQLGSATYYERFRKIMGDHVPFAAIERYFQAQSMWDDTMAWQAVSRLADHSFLVVIVGEFHVAFMDGLPLRTAARGAKQVVTVSQLGSCAEMLASDGVEGPRADFILLAEDCEQKK